MRFFDQNTTGSYGSYSDPFLQDIQAGAINWNSYYSGYPMTSIDYGTEKVLYFSFQTGSTWTNSFDGYIDAIEVALKSGNTLTIDLEDGVSEVWVDDDWARSASGSNLGDGKFYGYNAFDKIQDGINAVEDGGTVYVNPGTYTEGPQIAIDNNLSIVGVDKATTIIKPSADTGSSGNARGWWLVSSGVTLNLSNVTLDGTGKQVFQAIRVLGTAVIDNVTFNNIQHSKYLGFGVVLFGGTSGNEVKNSTFANMGREGIMVFGSGTQASINNNTYTGKGAGDWLDYGIEVGGGGQATISNNTVTNCKGIASTDGSTSAGILVTTYYGSGTSATITSNTITGNSYGITVGCNASDTSIVTANYNNISGNTDYGVNSTASMVDAKYNWWGENDKSGPYHHTLNPNGTGCAVSDNVSFAPWIGKTGSKTEGHSEGVVGETVSSDSTETFENGAIGIGMDMTTNSNGSADGMLVKYSGNPTNLSFQSSFDGSYYDLNVTNPGNINEIALKLYYPANHKSITPFWFNAVGNKWEVCSDWNNIPGTVSVKGVSYAGYVKILINNSTTPSLSDLTGTYFALGGSLYTIVASAGPHGSISPSGDVEVNYGANQTFTITPDAGYMINKILVDGSPVHFIHTSGDTYTFTNVTSNHTISATFTPKPIPTFVVEALVSVYGGYATVTPKEQTVQSGNSAKITINPDAGYHITEVTDNGKAVPMSKLVKNAKGTYTYTILAVYENHKIVVTLEKNEYIIKAKAGEGGTISPSGNVTVKYNSTQSFTITPDPGYKIDKIIVDGKTITSTEQEYRFTNIKGNHTIEVTFAKLPVKTSLLITLQINNPEITINGISKTIDAQGSKPIIRNSRTLLPIRSLIEALGGTIEWNAEKREVSITLNGNTIILTIGKNTALVNGIKTSIDPHNSNVVPIIINGRTYLPLRFIAEHLNCTVDWNPKNKEITIYYWG